MPIEERLEALAREDKWYLAGGDGLVWAPPFPAWLHRPGFWDEAQLYDQAFAPLFSVALIAADGREIALRHKSARWRPDYLDVRWESAAGQDLLERRYALPGGRLSSRWRPAREGADWTTLGRVHLVAFTAQPGELVSPEGLFETENGVRFSRKLVDRRGVEMWVSATLSADLPPSAGLESLRLRRAALRSEGALAQPFWRFTPFLERWQHDGVREELRLQGLSERGLSFVAIDAPLVGLSAKEVVFSIDLVPREPAPDASGRAPRTRPGVSQSPTLAWQAFFEGFPSFECSDPFLARYYDYRIYGLRLNRLEGGLGPIRHPAIAEGIGSFHQPITYSAQCHMWEMRWSRDPAAARGSLLNFIENQKPDGSFHGRLHTRHLEGTDFYHANWGDAVLALESVHPGRGFLERAYAGLARYARWLDETRDPERSYLYDVIDQYETGQEYMSRYLAVDPNADRYDWENRIRLKGVDVTVYAYQLKRALATLARRLELEDAPDWEAQAAKVGQALLEKMWDETTGFFSDVNPRSGQQTRVKPAVCFYPLLTDLLETAHVRRLLEHLQDPREFATNFPVPSSSRDDPYFNPDGEWKGKRHLCPWNGRVWPMTNSHVLEGLLRQWHAGRREVGPYAGRLLARFVRMLFHDGDVGHPNSFEHYNPFTGRASLYRGIDDYMHSWVLDLIVRGVTGLEPGLAGLRVDPLPMALDRASLRGALIAGHEVAVERGGDELRVTVDGSPRSTRVGTPLEIAW